MTNDFKLTPQEELARPFLEDISTYICNEMGLTKNNDQMIAINCIYYMVSFIKKNPEIDHHIFYFDNIIDKLDQNYALSKSNKKKDMHN